MKRAWESPRIPNVEALECRAAELEAALRALVEAQVRCEERGCEALATFVADDAAMMSVPYCEDHGYDHDGDEYARRLALKTAAPLRAALLLLAQGG